MLKSFLSLFFKWIREIEIFEMYVNYVTHYVIASVSLSMLSYSPHWLCMSTKREPKDRGEGFNTFPFNPNFNVSRLLVSQKIFWKGDRIKIYIEQQDLE